MIWILIAITLFTLWAASLCKVLRSSACIPTQPSFLSTESSENGTKRNILLVVAHPDDESMFFAPTILFLASKRHRLHILCMSTGNAEDKGNIRKEELYRACAVLKVPPQQVKIVDHPKLQDGFDKAWDHQLIATIVEEEVKTWGIDSIITFDKIGVSGHRNHRDVHHGICMLLRVCSQQNIEAWELISTSLLRKYSGPVDVWLPVIFAASYQRESAYCLINTHPHKSYLAMAAHYSQWIWFRKLFVLFSSYTYMNTLQKINA